MEEPGCGGQSVHQQAVHRQPVPVLPRREAAVHPCLPVPVPAGLPAVPALPAAREPPLGPGDQGAILLRQRILRFFSQIRPHLSHFITPKTAAGISGMRVSIVLARLRCLEGWQSCGKAATPSARGNGHEAPSRAHLGDGERREPRPKEQVPVEGYGIGISSATAASHTLPTSSAQAPRCSASPATGQRRPLGDSPLPALLGTWPPRHPGGGR